VNKIWQACLRKSKTKPEVVVCPICGGSGRVYLDVEDGRGYVCGRCSGLGELMSNEVKPKAKTNIFKSVLKFRPMMATCAVVLVFVASKELSWDGFFDRLIQFVLAYIAFCFAFSSENK
jgi:hypothetical protein